MIFDISMGLNTKKNWMDWTCRTRET